MSYLDFVRINMGREPLPDHYSYPVPFVHQANWGKNVQFQYAIPFLLWPQPYG